MKQSNRTLQTPTITSGLALAFGRGLVGSYRAIRGDNTTEPIRKTGDAMTPRHQKFFNQSNPKFGA